MFNPRRADAARSVPTVLAAGLIAIVVGLAVVGGAAPSPADASSLSGTALWFGDTAEPTLGAGANQVLRASGAIRNVLLCGFGGTNDFLFPATDVYIVPAGGEGGKLAEAGGGQPATIIGATGGAFIDEILGITGPGGAIGEGTYDVVFDACQDGNYDPGTDSVYRNVIRVAFPPRLPSYSGYIGDIKAKASKDAAQWLYASIAFDALRGELGMTDLAAAETDDPDASGVKAILDKILAFISAHSPPSGGIWDVIGSGINAAINQVKHYDAIASDPPDPDYKHPVVLPKVTTTLPTAPAAPVAAIEALAAPAQTEDAISVAFLQALERYQGATAAADPGWTLIHAREVDNLAGLLAAAQQRSAAAATAMSTSLASLPGFTALHDESGKLAARIQTRGFTGTETEALRNLGFDTVQIQRLRSTLPEQISCNTCWYASVSGSPPYPNSTTGLQQAMADLASAERDSAASLTAMAGRVDGVIDTLTGQQSVPQTAPTADAGGPYTTSANTAITLDASGSQPGHGESIASYAWDTDGDGQFDDATGASPTVTLGADSPGTVGVRVTGSDAQVTVAYAAVTIESGAPPSIEARSPQTRFTTVTVGRPAAYSVTGSGGTAAWTLDGTPVGTGDSYTLTATAGQVGQHDLQVMLTGSDGRSVATDWQLSVLAVDGDGDGWTASATADCNDRNALVNPGRPETIGNGIDDDCDPSTSDAPLSDYTGQAMSWGSDSEAATVLGRRVEAGMEAGTPSNVTGLGSTSQVAAGDDLGLAIDTDGAVWSWGRGARGQLGTGDTNDQPTPTAVLSPSGNGQLGADTPHATAIVANGQSAALLANGTVAAWGDNANGALGVGSSSPSGSIPALVQSQDGSSLSGVAAIGAGGDFLALATGGGALYVTGGVCGTSSGTVARKVTGLPAKVTRLAAGNGHLLILLADGALYGCGANDRGQLGAPTGGTIGAPRRIELPSGAAQPAELAAGDGFSLVLDSAGAVWAFGRNDLGQLGLGTTTDAATPTEVTLPHGATATELTAGGDSAALVRADGTVLTWGHGAGTPTQFPLPDGVRIAQLALDTTGTARYAVASRADAVVGWGTFAYTGAGGPGSPGVTPSVLDLPPLRDVATTGVTSVGVAADGTVLSWGGNPYSYGALGDGPDEKPHADARPILGIGGAAGSTLQAEQVAQNGRGGFFAVLGGGKLAAWGPWSGQWIGPTINGEYSPVLVPDAGGTAPVTGITQLATVGQPDLALTADGGVLAWGGSGPAQCRPDAPEATYLPTPVPSLGADNTQVAASKANAGLFLKADGSLYSCGNGAAPVGRTLPGGNHPYTFDPNPGQVQGMGPGSVVQVSASLEEALALETDGTVWGWGRNDSCSLTCPADLTGEGAQVVYPRQIDIPPGPPVVSVKACLASSYVIRADGSVLGWGYDGYDSLGITDPGEIVNPPGTQPVVVAPTTIPVPGGRPVWKITCSNHGGEFENVLALVGDPVAHLADPDGVAIAASVADTSVTEGGTADVTVALSHPAGLDLTLHYATADGSAKAGADYTASSGTIAIPAGQTTATVSVPTSANDTTQADRMFRVTLSDPATGYGPASWVTLADTEAAVTIHDDDPMPVVSIAGPSTPVAEGDAGEAAADFTLTLNHASSSTVSVGWATGDGTATAPGDYGAGHGTATFAPGQTTATVSVPVHGDTTMEPDETFQVSLSDPQSLTIGTASATATIHDDEPVVVTAGNSSVVSPVGAPAQAAFTIGAGELLSGESVTVAWQAVAGTAQVPGDVSGSGTVTLTHDQPSVTVEATVSAADGAARPHTLFYRLQLGSPSSSAGRSVLTRDGSGEITPAPGPTVSISGTGTVAEGSPLTLSASAAQGTPPYTYAWDLDGDGAFDDAAGAEISHTFPTFGTVAVAVQVTDDAGLTATAAGRVTVTDVAPVVEKLSDRKLAAGTTMHVSGTFADPGTESWSAKVDYGAGAGTVTLPLSGKSFTLAHAYADPGAYTVTVAVCDSGKLCGSSSFAVTVVVPSPPTVSIGGPDVVAEGSSLSLSAAASKGTAPYGYAWDLDGDGAFDDATGAGIGHTFPTFGTVAVAVQVTDGAGMTATASHRVSVSDVAPSVGALPDQRLTAGDTLHLSGSFADPGADDWTATVDYGAGPQPLTLAGRSFSLEHAFADPGSYRVTVAVCDDGKLCGSSSFTVAVAAPTRLAAAGAAKVDVAQQDKQGRYYHFINVTATLTSGTGPLAGQTVVFTADGGTICTATTADDGTAACPDDTKVDVGSFGDDVPATYTASFAGTDQLAEATATAALREIGPKH